MIKRFSDIYKVEKVNEELIDTGLTGLSSGGHRRIPAMTNRRTQYFYDYYTGQRIRGKSKYELNSAIFKMAQNDDEMGMLAQFILQVERESMADDIEHDADISEPRQVAEPSLVTGEIIEVKKFGDFNKVNEDTDWIGPALILYATLGDKPASQWGPHLVNNLKEMKSDFIKFANAMGWGPIEEEILDYKFEMFYNKAKSKAEDILHL